MAAPRLWCLGRSSKLRRPLFFLHPAGLEGAGTQRQGALFGSLRKLQLLRRQANRCQEKVLLTGSHLCCGCGGGGGGGVVCRRIGGTGKQLEQIPECYLSCGTDTAFPSETPPPLACTPISFPTYRAGSHRSLPLRQEVEKMLSKDALEIVLDPGPCFYSRLFMVEKATGGWRHVIDLSHLNELFLQTPFKMETVALCFCQSERGISWLPSI